MVFSSIIFLFYFLPIMLAAYFLTPRQYRNGVLFAGSLVFYAWGEPIYVFLMLLYTVFNFYFTKRIGNAETPKHKKRLFIVSLVLNLFGLAFLKYTNVLLELFGVATPVDILLPIGISIYTFQMISYVIDVYRGKVKSQEKFIVFGTYVTMFPQLIAGPVVRYSAIEKQLEYRRETIEGFTSGLICFTVGLSKKVLLANNIGLLWDTVHKTALSDLSVLSAWLGILAFAFQIYFVFSGYSDMAIGLGRMFGFEIGKNFDYPYTSKSITEFWRRWYISISTWFKEYVYIPLGGNRVKPARAMLNILIVWTLVGLWHGASLNFLLWGLYYALLLIFEKNVLSRLLKKLPGVITVIYTFILVLLGWVLFATDNLAESFGYFKAMFGFSGAGFVTPTFYYDLLSNMVLIISATVASTPYVTNIGRRFLKKSPSYFVVPVAVGLLLCIAYIVTTSHDPFLYFRF